MKGDGHSMKLDIKQYDKIISHKFLVRIQSIYGVLKSAEKRAADAILQNPEFIASSSIVDVAKIAQCSDATLVRLARKLGYGGYPELKSSLLYSSSNEDETFYEALLPTDDSSVIVDKVFNAAKQALSDTQELMKGCDYKKALSLITSAETLVFVGAGDAYIIAYSAYLKFSRCGFNARCSQDFDVQLVEASKLTENDVLIIITHSGNTQTLIEVAKCAKLKHAKIIAITTYPLSQTAKIADVVLLTASFSPNIYNEIMAKRIPELSVIEALYINAVLKSDKKYQETLQQSNAALLINKI